MSQQDVFEFLKEQRKLNQGWFSVIDIKNALIKKGFPKGVIKGVLDDVYKLAARNQIEHKGMGLWKYKMMFRGKKVNGF